MLSIEQFSNALPPKMRKSLNTELMNQVNKTIGNPDEYEHFRENLLSYTQVMQDGRFKISNYIDAVRYVSYKLMGCTNIDAYSRTFPDKIARFVSVGTSDKDISSYCSAYNKTKLVNLIFEQTLIPSHVLNQDLYQRALNVQADLMVNAKSEKVRTDAANSLLTQLKVPEKLKVELDVTHKEDDSIKALRETTMELAKQQRALIESGVMSAQGVAHSKIFAERSQEVEEAVVVGGGEDSGNNFLGSSVDGGDSEQAIKRLGQPDKTDKTSRTDRPSLFESAGSGGV